MFVLDITPEAKDHLKELKHDRGQQAKYKAVAKALILLQTNPKHPGLQTHKYHNWKGMEGQEVFEAYAQQHTPGAYRIFFYYGPGKDIITVFAITPHP